MAAQQNQQIAPLRFPIDCPACLSPHINCSLCEGKGVIIFETTEVELESAFLEHLGIFEAHDISTSAVCPFNPTSKSERKG